MRAAAAEALGEIEREDVEFLVDLGVKAKVAPLAAPEFPPIVAQEAFGEAKATSRGRKGRAAKAKPPKARRSATH